MKQSGSEKSPQRAGYEFKEVHVAAPEFGAMGQIE